MNVQDYIASGSIESCTLGLADADELQEFHRLCDQYEEIRAARDAFEASLESQAREGAVPPPAFLCQRILENLPLQTREPRIGFRKKYLVAASIILLAASSLLNVYLYRQYRQSDNLYTDLLARQQEIAGNNQSMQTRLQEMEQDMQLIRNPDMQEIKMQPVNNTNSLTTVYWDVKSRDVYLMIQQLPTPAAGQQYQLWAIVEGTPVNAGVVAFEDRNGLLKMSNIPKAEAFAITLEKTGGSSSPTLTAMYVMGKV